MLEKKFFSLGDCEGDTGGNGRLRCLWLSLLETPVCTTKSFL